ncbi:MAG: bacterial/archaeal transporter family-2 protein [Solirubrobacteraceae bacterium]|nr:bacterial/archaeal transporter family-2 protein [Solirubrobacteraceae bacterium]MEA2335461.1 bacterial/archaeal transporter family-2 protein [Solirubrobacteraceae bacterium]
MSRAVAVSIGVGAGCLVGMQAPINSRLGKSVGTPEAATFSFLVGTVALVLILLIARGGVGGLGQIGRAPWWALVGGLLGAVYVSVALVAVRTLGASGLTAVVIGGQLAISVVIDRFGLLGVAKQAVGAQRILGLALLAVGVALVVRK